MNFNEDSDASLNLSTSTNSNYLPKYYSEDIDEPSEYKENDSQQADPKNQSLISDLSAFIKKKYLKSLKEMCSFNLESIKVDYMDLQDFHEQIEESPSVFIGLLNEALTKVTKEYFPSYFLIKPLIFSRICNYPVIESIRNLRNAHLNRIVRIQGVVTRRSSIYSQYSLVKYTCLKCRATFGPFLQRQKPSVCFECQKKSTFVINSAETIYKDFQKILIQEMPNSVKSGNLPRSKELIVYNELIDSCKPGDDVDVVGIYKNDFSMHLNLKNNFPVFSTLIEVCSITKKVVQTELTEEDLKEIKEISKDSNVVERLIASFAPGICGHREVKTAILLSLVGGNVKERNGMRIRGDINILMMGDPGTAKSQFLRYVHQVASRSVLATGQNSSAVGLTASVRKDPVLKEFVLEGGALVLADKGICCIDEFDKMNENDRVAIHEAMEQQSISISKAGIVASLHARCAVIAAANPVRGKYNSSLSFAQNVNLSEPIISRFDILCVIRDVIEENEDRRISRFIIDNHFTSVNKEVPVKFDLLKKYLRYARENCHPKISELDSKKIANLYADLRKASIHSGIPITVRHIESIIRTSEAFAKLRLSNYVTKGDIDLSISLTLKSFLNAQKHTVSRQLRKKFAKYFDENTDDLLIYLMKKMLREKLVAVGIEKITTSEFATRCKQCEISFNSRFFLSQRFVEEGFIIKNETILRKSK